MTAPSLASRSRNAGRACGSAKRSGANGATSASGVSPAYPKIDLRWGLAASVGPAGSVGRGFEGSDEHPSCTASNRRAEGVDSMVGRRCPGRLSVHGATVDYRSFPRPRQRGRTSEFGQVAVAPRALRGGESIAFDSLAGYPAHVCARKFVPVSTCHRLRPFNPVIAVLLGRVAPRPTLGLTFMATAAVFLGIEAVRGLVDPTGRTRPGIGQADTERGSRPLT